MSTIGNDVQTGSTDDGALSVDDAAKAFLKRWEDQDKPASKDVKETADDAADETDEAPAETESEDTDSEVEASDEDPEAAEDTEDQDADEEDKKSAKSASDEMEVVLSVDGKEHRVSVKDLKRLYGQEAALTRKSQAVAAKQKEYEESTTKVAHALSVLTDKAMQKWKPYAEIDWAVAQSQLSPADFATLRMQAKNAFDEAKFLTEELDSTMKDA